MKIEKLPKGILNYLWRFEFSPKWGDKEKFAVLSEELKKFGYEITDEDFEDGETVTSRGIYGF